jgi:cobalamin biosynthesis Co2+ chelatase CbiK
MDEFRKIVSESSRDLKANRAVTSRRMIEKFRNADRKKVSGGVSILMIIDWEN